MKDNLMHIAIDGVIYIVYGEADEAEKLVKDCGYTHEGMVYIYGGKLKKTTKPGYFYKTDKDKLLYAKPDKCVSDYKVENIVDVRKVKEDACNPASLKEMPDMDEDMRDLNIFDPPIKPDDDILKKVIKMVLHAKQVDMKHYKKNFDKDYDLTNLKATVTKDAPMSMKYFLRWIVMCDLDVEIVVKSAPGSTDRPLKEPIHVKVE
jgi:hypothetical protein